MNLEEITLKITQENTALPAINATVFRLAMIYSIFISVSLQGFCFVKVKIKIQCLVKLFLVIRDTERMNWKQSVVFSINHAYIKGHFYIT